MGLDDDVVDVDLDVFADLLAKASLHAALVGGASILQAEGHDVVAVDACWRDECSEFLIFGFQLDLVVPRISVEEQKEGATRSAVDNLVDARQREVVLRVVLVQVGEVDAHTQGIGVFLRHHHWVCHPGGLFDLPNETGLRESMNFGTHGLALRLRKTPQGLLDRFGIGVNV